MSNFYQAGCVKSRDIHTEHRAVEEIQIASTVFSQRNAIATAILNT